MELSTSMDPFLNISTPWQCTSSDFNTLYQLFLYVQVLVVIGEMVYVKNEE